MSIFSAGKHGWLRMTFALFCLAFLASCQNETPVQPVSRAQADSVHVQDIDPPVMPGGPGGGH